MGGGGELQPALDADSFVSRVNSYLVSSSQLAARFPDRHGRSYPPVYEAVEGLQGGVSSEQLADARAFESVRPRLSDVEVSVERFAEQDHYFRAFRMPTPAALIGGKYIPIDIGASNLHLLPPEAVVSLASAVVDNRTSLRAEFVEPEEAEKGFRQNLHSFVKARLFGAGRRSSEVLNTALGTGYDFVVTTHSKGLRVHYSPAYFLNMRLAFGSPTTPVKSKLQPGRYVFGAFPPQKGYWDEAEYDVPGPTSEAHLAV